MSLFSSFLRPGCAQAGFSEDCGAVCPCGDLSSRKREARWAVPESTGSRFEFVVIFFPLKKKVLGPRK